MRGPVLWRIQVSDCSLTGQQVFDTISSDWGVVPPSKWDDVYILIGIFAAWVLAHVAAIIKRIYYRYLRLEIIPI